MPLLLNNIVSQSASNVGSTPVWLSLLTIMAGVFGLLLLHWRFLFSNQASRQAIKTIKKLMNKSQIKFFPFYILAHHIGGYEDQELRQLLVGAGAIRVTDNIGMEYWVLKRFIRKFNGLELAQPIEIENKFPSADKFVGTSREL